MIMPTNNEKIALLMLYGTVTEVSSNTDKIGFQRSTGGGCLCATPRTLHLIVREWMNDAVKEIEIENKRAR